MDPVPASAELNTNASSKISSSAKSRSSACMRCRKLKVHCTGSLPCERCFHLSLVCRPQIPTPYKRDDSGREGDKSKERQGSGNGYSSARSNTVSRRKQGGDQRKKQDVDAALATAVRVEADRALLLELIFDRLDPRPLAAIFLETVTEAVTQSQTREGSVEVVDRSWTVSFLRSWWIHSSLAGADTTWGMGKTVARLLDVSSFDMEDAETVRLDFPAHTIPARRQDLQAKVMVGMVQIKQHPVFQRLLGQLSPAAAVYAAGVTADGLTVEVSNQAFDVLFRGADRLFSDVAMYKTLPHILFLGLVAPDDRREWSRFIVEATMKAPSEPEGDWRRTRIFKLVGAEGNIQLFLVEARPVPGLGGGGMAIILEPCPPSRHLNQQPGTTPRAGHRSGENVAAILLSELAPTRLKQAISGRSRGEGLGEGRRTEEVGVKGMEEGSGVVLPGMAVVPIARPPNIHAFAHKPPAEELEDLEAIFGLQEHALSALSSPFSGGCDEGDIRTGKMLPTSGQVGRGCSSDHNPPPSDLAKQFSHTPALACLSSSMIPSASTLSTVSAPSSSSPFSSSLFSSSTPSSSSPSSSSIPFGSPSQQQQREQQHQQLQQPICTLEPVYQEAASPAAGLSEWGCSPPVLDADLLKSVFREGEDAT